VDTDLTINGRKAAVRSAISTGSPSAAFSNAITVWDLTVASTPTAPTFTITTKGEGISLASGGYKPSDLVRLTNIRAAAIGSGISTVSGVGGPHDQTYIDLVDLSSGAHVASHTVGQTTTSIAQNQWAGIANDVEITRDGAYAVVNSDNYVHIMDMGSGTLTAVNIGEVPFGPSTSAGDPLNLCTPNAAVDSVALSSSADSAVVTTSRVAAGLRDTWVYIVDIPSGTVPLEFQLLPPSPEEHPYTPHDVAVTPDGTMAVVTANHMVGLFDLVSNTFLAMDHEPEAWRQYQIQVDSVEVTNSAAIVISDFVPSSGGPTRWMIHIYSISRTTAPFLVETAKYIDPTVQGPDSRAHDLELLPPDKVKALVRTSFDNVFVDLVTPGTVPTAILTSPGGSNAHAYINYAAAAQHPVFSSDSVAIAYFPGTTQDVAVTVGATEPSPGVFQGHVDFIDFNGNPLVVGQQIIVSSSGAANGAVPLDLAFARDRSEVFVRCSDTLVDSPLASGADVSCFSLTGPTPFTLLQDYGGRGFVVGVDSIVGGTAGPNPQDPTQTPRKRIVSASEDSTVPSGYVHLVDR
jgi:hypothetical protein